MDTRPTRRRSVAVTLGITAVFATTLSGCSSSQTGSVPPQQQPVSPEEECVDGVSRGGFGRDCDDVGG